ncbi:hypothetical protein Bca4012_084523 [Brassica carinata]
MTLALVVLCCSFFSTSVVFRAHPVVLLSPLDSVVLCCRSLACGLASLASWFGWCDGSALWVLSSLASSVVVVLVGLSSPLLSPVLTFSAWFQAYPLSILV